MLQHLLLAAMLSCVVTWTRCRKNWLLFAAGFAAGLALWDKALFLWNLSSMVVVVLILQFRFILSLTKRTRLLGLLSLGLFIGSLPLIAYNIGHHGETISGNAHLTATDLKWKAWYLTISMDGWGSSAFTDVRYPAPDLVARPLANVSRAMMSPSLVISSWRVWLFAVLVPAGLFLAEWSQRKWILFFLLSGGLAWLQAALTLGAAGSIHHVVLMWPLFYWVWLLVPPRLCEAVAGGDVP